MSTLSQFFGGQSVIKSIQRGISAGAASRTVTISAVDTSKSVVVATYTIGRSFSSSSGQYIAVGCAVSLTNSTTLQITETSRHADGSGVTNTDTTVAWQVIEFN